MSNQSRNHHGYDAVEAKEDGQTQKGVFATLKRTVSMFSRKSEGPDEEETRDPESDTFDLDMLLEADTYRKCISEGLRRMNSTYDMMVTNIIIVLTGIIMLAVIDRYLNDKAIANISENLMSQSIERLMQECNEFYMLPVLINSRNVDAFLRGDLRLGETLDGKPDGNITNENDIFFTTPLQVYGVHVNYVYVATEAGYYLGAARRNDDEDIVVVAKESGDCTRQEFVLNTESSFRTSEIAPHRFSDQNSTACGPGALMARDERKSLCYADGGKYNEGLCEKYVASGTYFGCRDDDEDATGYEWNDEYEMCEKIEVYDHREKGWYQSAFFGDDDVIWSEAYPDVATGATVVTAMQRVEYNGTWAVFAVDASIKDISQVMKDSNIAEGLNHGGQNYLYEYQAEDGGRKGLLWATSEATYISGMALGSLYNILTSEETLPSGEVQRFSVVDVMEDSLNHVMENFVLPMGTEGEPDARYVRSETEIASGDMDTLLIAAGTFDPRTHIDGVVVMSFPKEHLFNYYEDGVTASTVICIFAIILPLARALSVAYSLKIERMYVDEQLTNIEKSLKDEDIINVSVRAKMEMEYIPPSFMKAPTFFLLLTFMLSLLTHSVWSDLMADQIEYISNELTREVNLRVQSALEEILLRPADINELNGLSLRQKHTDNMGAARDEDIFLTSYEYFRDDMLRYLDSRTPLTGFHVTSEEGEYLGVATSYSADTILSARKRDEDTGLCLLQVGIDPETGEADFYDLNEAQFLTCEYDPREEGWYQAATDDGVQRWTEVYDINGNYVLTAVQRWITPDGEIVTLAVDVSLDTLSSYLRQVQGGLSVFTYEQFFIPTTGGALIASNNDEISENMLGQVVRKLANESDDSVARMVAEYLWNKYDSGDPESPGEFTVGYGQELSIVSLSDLTDSFGVNWDNVVAMSRKSYMETVDEYTAESSLIGIGMCMLSAFIGIIWAQAKGLEQRERDGIDNAHEKKELSSEEQLRMFTVVKNNIRESMGKLPGTVRVVTGKAVAYTTADLSHLVQDGDYVRIGSHTFAVEEQIGKKKDLRIALDRPWPEDTCEEMAVYKWGVSCFEESEEETSKRFILDAAYGRSVLDIVNFERKSQYVRRKAYYLTTSSSYLCVLRIVMLLHLLLAFFEAPEDSYALGDSNDDRKTILRSIEGGIMAVQVFDVAAELIINGMYQRDKKTRIPRLRFRNLFRVSATAVFLVDWLMRMCGAEYTTGDSIELLLPLSSPARPILVIAQDPNFSSAFMNFLVTLIMAKDVFVVLLCFVMVAACTGIALFAGSGVYEEAYKIGRGYDDYRSAFYTVFIFIATGENYPDVIYPASEESQVYKIYYMIFFFIGMLLLVSLIIAIFQEQYTANYEKVEEEKREQKREGILAAFVLLDADDSDILEPGEYQSFFGNVCATGEDFAVLEGVSFKIDDWVEVCEQLVELFDTGATLDQRHAAAARLQGFWRGYSTRKNLSEKEKRMMNRLRKSQQAYYEQLHFSWKRQIRRWLKNSCHPPHWFVLLRAKMVSGEPVFPKLQPKVASPVFSLMVVFLVMMNVWCLSLLGTTIGDEVAPMFLVILILYVFEIGMKLFAFGSTKMFKMRDKDDPYLHLANRFDTVIVMASFFLYVITRSIDGTIYFEDSDPLRFVLALPTLRTLSVVKSARTLIFGIMSVLPGVGVLFLLLFLIVYIFAALGCILYAGSFDELPEYDLPDANFNSMEASFTTLFQMISGEAWSDIMYAAIDSTSQYESATFFITYVIVITLLFANLFIGVVCDAFSTLQRGEVHVDVKRNVLDAIAKKAAELKKANEAPDDESVSDEDESIVVGPTSLEAEGVVVMPDLTRKMASELENEASMLSEMLFREIAEAIRTEYSLEGRDGELSYFNVDEAYEEALHRGVDALQYHSWIVSHIQRKNAEYGFGMDDHSTASRGSDDDNDDQLLRY
eukprot:Rmarinus@m.1353